MGDVCSLSEWQPDSLTEPPPKSGFQTLYTNTGTIQEGGGAEVEPGRE